MSLDLIAMRARALSPLAVVLVSTLIVSTAASEEATPSAPSTSKDDAPSSAKTSAKTETKSDKADAAVSANPNSSEWGVDGPYVLDVHGRIGGALRLDAPPAYEQVSPGGLLVGASVGLGLSSRISVALTYEHIDLGSERSNVLKGGVVNISRELHTAWLGALLYPIRVDRVGVYLSLAAGIAVQEADLSASVWLPENPGDNVSFFCAASGGPGFGFQGALGVDVVVVPGVRFLFEGGAANHRLTSDVLDRCAPGAGTATVLAVRTGLGYAWDL